MTLVATNSGAACFKEFNGGLVGEHGEHGEENNEQAGQHVDASRKQVDASG
jgi:hypothetical protein